MNPDYFVNTYRTAHGVELYAYPTAAQALARANVHCVQPARPAYAADHPLVLLALQTLATYRATTRGGGPAAALARAELTVACKALDPE